MSARRIVLLPFEVSRRAPEPLPDAFVDDRVAVGDEDVPLADDQVGPGDREGASGDGGLATGDAATDGSDAPPDFGAPIDPSGSDQTFAGDATFPADASGEGELFEDGGSFDDEESFESEESFEDEESFAGDPSFDADDSFDSDATIDLDATFDSDASFEGFDDEFGEEEFLDEEFSEEPVSEEAFADDEDALAGSDRAALARWLRDSLASLLAASNAFAPLILELEDEAETDAIYDDPDEPLFAEPAAAAASATGAELALQCAVRANELAVEMTGLIADTAGEERVRFTLGCALGAAWQLPARAAREILLALGEDAAAPPPIEELELSTDAILAMIRGAQSLAEATRSAATPIAVDRKTAPAPADPTATGDADPTSAARADPTSAGAADTTFAGELEANGMDAPPPRDVRGAGPVRGDPGPAQRELLDAISLAPEMLPARDLLLRGAADAAGGPWMPSWLSALERLESILPGDARVLLALADYRRLHHDDEAARELLFRARDLADDDVEEAEVLARLALLAESAGRTDEAMQHLRAATRLADDPSHHFRLGLLLRTSDSAESVRSLQRATVLAPNDPMPRLFLARQLRAEGDLGRAADEAARAMQLAAAQPETAQAATDLLRELIEAAREP